MQSSSRFARVSLATAGIATTVAVLVNLWLFHDYLIDDTFISLRYARNLAEGIGLVFNRGEYVEGYTNFSWVLFTALCFAAGVDAITAARLLSAVTAIVVLILLGRMETWGPHQRRSLAPWFLVAGPAFVYWSVAAFETIPFVAIFVLALWLQWADCVRGYGHRAAIAWIALALTRPEGLFLFAVASVGFAIASAIDGKRVIEILRRHVVTGLWVAAGILPHLSWRYWYYGDIVPNTFHAKVTGGSEQYLTGLKGLGQWASGYPAHALATVAIFALLSNPGRRLVGRHPYILAIAIVVAAQVVYVAAVGGDFMPYFRFFQPVLPLSALLLAWATSAIAGNSATKRAAFATAVITLTLATSHATTQRMVAFVSNRTTVNGIRVGKHFATELAPESWIAINTAGVIPFYSRLPSLDMLGLTDANIARRQHYIISTGWAGHRKGWGRYVLKRSPERILWYNTTGDRRPFYLGDHELAESPHFRLFYSLKSRQLERIDEPEVLGRFLGTPFGDADVPIASPELAFVSVVKRGWPTTTAVHPTDLVVHSFDLDGDLAAMLPNAMQANADELIDRAIALWKANPLVPAERPGLRRQIEETCKKAQKAATAGDIATAKQLLARAAASNEEVRSALVYQYITNVAVMTGEPFIALAAQKQALRIRPGNPVYRRNLRALLTTPYETLSKKRKLVEPG